jgi:hypothetical protein
MENNVGRARFDGKKLHFDDIGWKMVTTVARRLKKSPKYIVVRALKRYGRLLKRANNG